MTVVDILCDLARLSYRRVMEPPEQVQGSSPEGPGQAPGQEKRPVRVGLWLTIAAVVIACGVCVGNRLLASVFTSTSELTPEENAAIVAATTYMDAVLADDVAIAYGLTCTKIHNDMTLSEFEAYQSDRGQISRYELVDVHVSSSDGRLNAIVETQMYATNGATFPQNIAVAKESAGWRVCE
jgi:flavorubredoxin